MIKDKQCIALMDLPSDNDWLGSEKYVEGLTEYVYACPTPMTISVQAEWGVGKSTFLKMMKSKINTMENICFLEFNAWLFSQFTDGTNLPLLMLDYFITKLSESNENKKHSVAKNAIVNVMKIGTQVLTGGAANGEELFDVFKKSPLSAYMELREEIKKILAEKKEEKIVFAIDDLDRIEPDKAVELLEVMKNFLDFEKCVLILAIDYDVIARGLRIKYGSDFEDEKAKSFFDKIIQVPFKIPVSNLEYKSYVKCCLEQVGLVIDEHDIDDYYSLIKYSIGCNPRVIKRLINLFSLQRTINAKVNEQENINNKLLFAILCLQNSYEEIYDDIILEKDKINSKYLKTFFEREEGDITFQNSEKNEKYNRFLECFSNCAKINRIKNDTYDVEGFIATLTVDSVAMLIDTNRKRAEVEKKKNYSIAKKISIMINEKYPEIKFKPVSFSATVDDEVGFYYINKIDNQSYGLMYSIYTSNQEKLLGIEFYSVYGRGETVTEKIKTTFEDNSLKEKSKDMVYTEKSIRYVFDRIDDEDIEIIEKGLELFVRRCEM